jgi:hypothetical protein
MDGKELYSGRDEFEEKEGVRLWVGFRIRIGIGGSWCWCWFSGKSSDGRRIRRRNEGELGFVKTRREACFEGISRFKGKIWGEGHRNAVALDIGR